MQAADLVEGLREARARTEAIVAGVGTVDLEAVHSPLMSPLVWDLGHIAAYEDLWLRHRFAGEPLLRADLAEVYDAFETPRAGRGALPYLHRDEAWAYLAEVRERVLARIAEHGAGDGVLHELVIRHELQHGETMLQAIELARLERGDGKAPAHVPSPAPGAASSPTATGLELVEVPAGPFELGAPADGFAYDNERPRHTVELPAFRIGRLPVTNADFERFVADGGYERAAWWDPQGWHWLREQRLRWPGGWDGDGREWRGGGWRALDSHLPVLHVSWWEADAFARSHGLRLATEAEWERAAGAGVLAGVGEAWEWTASCFGGYPGFVAHPYREYSEVFFGDRYRVLRGSSWATHARVATPTFRNWDLPQRRQIFAGLRVAEDAA